MCYENICYLLQVAGMQLRNVACIKEKSPFFPEYSDKDSRVIKKGS